MHALEAIITRHSIAPAFLTEPGPDDEALGRICAAGAAAPDHGRLRPWRFTVIRGDARARFGEVLADALRARDPEATAKAIDQERQRPQRAPVLIAVVGRIDRHHAKIPAVEQVLSTGAAAQNMLLAAHALGFAGKWLTGAAAYDQQVRNALNLADEDVLAGFLHLGTAAGTPPTVPHAEAAEHSSEWRGAGDLRPL